MLTCSSHAGPGLQPATGVGEGPGEGASCPHIHPGDRKTETPSPMPLFKTQVDLFNHITLVTEALFTSPEIFRSLVGEPVSMPLFSGGRGMCSGLTWVSSRSKTTALSPLQEQ